MTSLNKALVKHESHNETKRIKEWNEMKTKKKNYILLRVLNVHNAPWVSQNESTKRTNKNEEMKTFVDKKKEKTGEKKSSQKSAGISFLSITV